MIRKSILVLSFLFAPLLWSQEVDFKTIQLSYISNDRAAGILKSLGYAVIDFEVSNGPNPNEFIYKPSGNIEDAMFNGCLLYTSPSPRDQRGSGLAGSA